MIGFLGLKAVQGHLWDCAWIELGVLLVNVAVAVRMVPDMG
jgi:hypothetical protein